MGGWLIGQREQLKHSVSLVICSIDARVKQPEFLTIDSVDYAVLPTGSREEFSALLQNAQPDLVHLWGSENPAAPALVSLCSPERILLSAQGIMTPYTEHLLDGVPYIGVLHIRTLAVLIAIDSVFVLHFHPQRTFLLTYHLYVEEHLLTLSVFAVYGNVSLLDDVHVIVGSVKLEQHLPLRCLHSVLT